MPNLPLTCEGRSLRGPAPALIALLTVLLISSPALATDGVLEINETCAVQTGCFAGDAPGYPVTITGSIDRSFRLTSDLVVGDPNTDGIEISISRVEIDFNGFSLIGFSLGSGTGNGVTGGGVDGSFAGYATLRNGAIRGARNLGVALGGAADVRIERMTLESNAGGGVALGDGAVVVDSRIIDNGSSSFDGVAVGERAIVRGNSVHGSGGRGIYASDHAIVEHNVVTNSGGDGIEVEVSSLVARNVSSDNAGRGIAATFGGGTIAHNTVATNGGDGIDAAGRSLVIANTVRANMGHGVDAAAFSSVRDNTVSGNAMVGLSLDPGVLYSQNAILPGLAGSSTVTGGVDAGDNMCGQTMGCP